eukprot:TRINITY_DN4148_c1_g1_i1.p1 TRINITY_DN4148_c1_g1~~TRINITY_DN4148_c1_g1_i1.p1  ORF type:complete len:427 (-),score=75.53 TRINITY_DN4148_c1_g1_i1:62-1342(-)
MEEEEEQGSRGKSIFDGVPLQTTYERNQQVQDSGDDFDGRGDDESAASLLSRMEERGLRNDDECSSCCSEDEATLEDHADVVMTILQPVAITMILVIWIVKVMNNSTVAGMDKEVVRWYMVYHESGSDTNTTKLLGSALNALLFVAMVLLVTCLFVVLYKYRCLKVLYTWLIGSTGMLLAVFGSTLFYVMLQGYNIPFDWISFSFLVWNFSVGGLMSIFWYGPMKVQQGYLIIVSVLLAVFFTKLPEWTTWAILAGVAIYDLFAVLCPRGPLKVLVETAQERREPIPALLYSGSLFMMMAGNDEDDNSVNDALMEDNEIQVGGAMQPMQVIEPEPQRRRSIKLGLGDFVFYSVLVGRAALFDIITVFTCFIGIITGLFFTLLLLAIFRKALPALPISIFFGLVFYILTKEFLLPFILITGSRSVFA